MPVFRLTKNAIEPLPETEFYLQGVRERSDLQRVLRANIAVVAPDVLVIDEEFGDWEDSRRRIDLLAVDRDANLVVIEIKRDSDGGHMELQAIRYAAMVSTMTFARAVEVFQSFLERIGTKSDAKTRLLEFLEWEEPREDAFAQDVRVVLVAAEFSKEITTSVLWLNERDMDIRCVRLKPFSDGNQVIVEAQQVVPLPEAQDYTVQLKKKDQAVREEKADRHHLRHAFWKELLPAAAGPTPRFAGLSPTDDHWISAASGYPGMHWNYLIWKDSAGGELYIDRGVEGATWNKAVFDYLHARRSEIETAYGGPLKWYRLDDKRCSRIMEESLPDGIKSPREKWPSIRHAMIDSMRRLQSALEPHLPAAIRDAAERSHRLGSAGASPNGA
jgi:RecB family endonuclease NucS